MKKQQATMRKGLLSMAFLATSLLSVNAQTVVGTFGRLQTTTIQKNGKEIAIVGAENGTPISLAGMSLFWSNDWEGATNNFYNAESINHVADNWKISIIRAAMGVKEEWDDGRGYVDNPQGQTAKIKKVIDAAIAKGIYVIIDYHTHYAEKYQSQAITFFGQMAKEYGNYPNVIYEIYNEPLGDSKDTTRTPWPVVKNYADDVIKAIRVEDPDNLIVVGTPTWAQEVDKPASDPIKIDGKEDANLAYTLHFYAGSEGHKEGLRDRAQKAMEDGAPLFVTEWGSVNANGDGGVDMNETNKWLDFMKEYHLNHVNWNLGDKNEGSSAIKHKAGVTGLKNDELTNAGNFIKQKLTEIAEDQTLSTENFSLNGEAISVYPNPAADRMTISTKNTSITSVKIIDMQGREVLKNNYKSTKATIDVSALSKGFYVLQLNNKTSRKIIIE